MNPEVQNSTPESDDLSSLRQIRTYQGDVADALKNQGESVMSIRRAELVKRGDGDEFAQRPTPQEEIEKGSRNKIILLIIGTILLLALGGLGVWYAYNGYKAKTALPVVVVTPNAFISTDSSVDVDASGLARDTFISAFNDLKNGDIKNASIKQIQLRRGIATTTLSTTAEFLNIINTKAPSSLVRAFNPLFMLGVIGDTDASSTPHTFVLVKLDSYENTFPRMLSWEQDMGGDLLPLFASSSVATNFPTDTKFVDVTIQNKDARALKDSTGNTVLLYSFFDNNMLIITDNEASLKTLVARLNVAKLSR
jgi:hypothetical protein